MASCCSFVLMASIIGRLTDDVIPTSRESLSKDIRLYCKCACSTEKSIITFVPGKPSPGKQKKKGTDGIMHSKMATWIGRS